MRYGLNTILMTFALMGAIAPAHAQTPSYKITKTIPLGAPDSWDYLYFEPQEHRVYVAHLNEITVVDGHSGDVVGRVQGVTGVNGIVAIPALGKGYTDSRAKKAGIAFDLKTFQVTKEIPSQEDTDGITYDAATKRVFIANGDPGVTTVIDAATDKPLGAVTLTGKPEFLVSDDAGHVFVNIADKREIDRIDAKTLKVEAHWPIAECQSPHGLAIDRATHRLFSSCVNSQMVVVDSDKGTIIATVPIGKGTDAVGFDPKRKLAFSSNGEGNLSVIAEQGSGTFKSLGNVPTKPFARTMAIDPDTGRIYLVTADMDEVDPKAENLRQRYQIKRGTVQLLFLDPS